MTPNNPASRGRAVPTIDYNIVVLGSAGVGKSSMISRYTTGHFSRGYTPTIEERYRKEQTIAGRRYRQCGKHVKYGKRVKNGRNTRNRSKIGEKGPKSDFDVKKSFSNST